MKETDEDTKLLQMRVGYNVRRLRTESNLSRKATAERVGIGVRTLQRVEAGKSNVRIKSLAALSIGLGVDVSVLLQPLPPPPPSPS